MNVYLVCIVANPTAKQKHDDGAVAQIIVQPQAVLATDEQQATLKAARLIPEEWVGKEERLSIQVLSFRSAPAAVGVGR